jgi:uncharacterized membrane protein (UPF0127 family)
MLKRDNSRVKLKLFSLPIIFAVFLFGCTSLPRREICFNKVCITAEIADNDFNRQQGLMFRKSLLPKQGMLFVFNQEDRYSFWMKNMLIPLDFIWISSDLRIVDIMTDVLPCVDVCDNLTPKEKIKYVLEVNAGFVKKHKLNLGEQVFLDTKTLLH